MSEEPFLVGELLDDKYQIEKMLGQGGMGAVYRAIHLGTKRIVAIKVIHPQFSNDEEFVERFRREAEATGRLRHPNVVDVTDFGFAKTSLGRVAYLVMEFLDGCTLEEILAEEKSLRLAWVVDILDEVCSAVDAAHRIGIVHRDLKPDNIWLEPNRRGGYTVKVLDFGLVKLGGTTASAAIGPAKSVASIAAFTAKSGSDSEAATLIQPSSIPNPNTDDVATLIQKPSSVSEPVDTDPNADASEVETAVNLRPEGVTGGVFKIKTEDTGMLTQVGSVMGTPLYMSPEQCRGDAVDARSDVYSLGVIAYRMLAGETPFTGKVIDLIRSHSTVEPESIRARNRKVPRRMARVVMAALAKNPEERPQTAAGFASALRAGAEGVSSLLRQSISLYSERFPIFLKMSLVANAPFIILVLLNHFAKAILRNYMSHNVILFLVALLAFLLTLLAQLVAHSVIKAVTVPVVIQSIVAPLRPIRIRAAFAILKRRWEIFVATTALVLISTIVGMMLCVLPGVTVAIMFALSVPVSMMEDLGVGATLKRAYRLMKRSKAAVVIITLLQSALPSIIYRSNTLNYNANTSQFSFFDSSGNLSQLLIILISPLTAIMTALLYLKTRDAGGEGVKDTMGHLYANEMPTSKWEQKMSSRMKL